MKLFEARCAHLAAQMCCRHCGCALDALTLQLWSARVWHCAAAHYAVHLAAPALSAEWLACPRRSSRTTPASSRTRVRLFHHTSASTQPSCQAMGSAGKARSA